MTLELFLASTESDEAPPEGLAPELEAMWYVKTKQWEAAHDIAQDLPTMMGSWIHGLLHAIEGDFGNSAYWYRQAGKTPIRKDQIEAEWLRIVKEILS